MVLKWIVKAWDTVVSLAMGPAGFPLEPVSQALIGSLRPQKPSRAVGASQCWNVLGNCWSLMEVCCHKGYLMP